MDLRILENAAEKIEDYNAQGDAKKYYNPAYHKLLNARPLVDVDGSVVDLAVGIIESIMRNFKMARVMSHQFNGLLARKLKEDSVKVVLREVRSARIESSILNEHKASSKILYETFSEDGSDSLALEEMQFHVGATKIMNFLFPDFYVMVDSRVAKALHRSGGYYFEKYWDTMRLCRQELDSWREMHCDLDSLILLDKPPTTLTRIFDKCAFVMGSLQKWRT